MSVLFDIGQPFGNLRLFLRPLRLVPFNILWSALEPHYGIVHYNALYVNKCLFNAHGTLPVDTKVTSSSGMALVDHED